MPDKDFLRAVRYTEKGLIDADLKAPETIAEIFAGEPPGTIMERGAAPPGIKLVYKFINSETCRRFVEYANTQQGKDATVTAVAGSDTEEFVSRLSAGRVTTNISTHGIAEELFKILTVAFLRHVNPYYGTEIEWFDLPSLLKYQRGGKYVDHSDADNWLPSQGRWQRAADRDFSVLIYLNDDFKGGELEFPNFDFKLRPKSGLLVCFPSDHRFVHRALPVDSGERYAIACWAASKGSERVCDSRPEGAVILDQN